MSHIDVNGLLKLAAVPGISSIRLRALVNHFKTPDAVFAASFHELTQVNGVDTKIAMKIRQFTNGEEFVQQQCTKLEQAEAQVITFWDAEYPEALKNIYYPPALLFIRGTLTENDKHAVAIVGTRRASDYGLHIAQKFATELAQHGVTIISGLAYGIDAAAHTAALNAGGRTIAVLGSGVDMIYPPENAKLADRIRANGCFLSEYPMGTEAHPKNFPARNRIISGLALGTLIVESGLDGGAMITAQFALDQDREVFAIPGHLTAKKSEGPNYLIKEGRAILVQSVDDVLCELELKLKPLAGKREEQRHDLSLFEATVLNVMTQEPTHIDTIVDSSNLSTSDVLVTLLTLEFKGLVRQMAGKMFVKT
jgi:DNA processing protein